MLLDSPVVARTAGKLIVATAIVLGVSAPSAGAAAADRLFWANDLGQGTTVNRCDLDAVPCSPETVAAEQEDPFGVAVNATHVYWTNAAENMVLRCELDEPRAMYPRGSRDR